MKIYKIAINNSVHEFIGELGEYIFRHTFNYESSKINMDNIYKEIFGLKIFPNRYPKFNERYRVLTISRKYRVFYIIDENNNKIIVSRIFSSHEDYYDET